MTHSFLAPFLFLLLTLALFVGTYCHEMAFRDSKSLSQTEVLKWSRTNPLGKRDHLMFLVIAALIASYFGLIAVLIVCAYGFWLNR